MTDLSSEMVRYLVGNGWKRQEEGTGWWWRDGFDEATLGGAVEEQLASDGVDARTMLDDEPKVFWDADESPEHVIRELDAANERIDRLIEAGVKSWHETVNDEPALHAWLGLTWDEYKAWAEAPSVRAALALLADTEGTT